MKKINKKHLGIGLGVAAAAALIPTVAVVLTSCSSTSAVATTNNFYNAVSDPYKELNMFAATLDRANVGFNGEKTNFVEKAQKVSDHLRDFISKLAKTPAITDLIANNHSSVLFVKNEFIGSQWSALGNQTPSESAATSAGNFIIEQPTLYPSIYSQPNISQVPGFGFNFPVPQTSNPLSLFDDWYEVGSKVQDGGGKWNPSVVSKLTDAFKGSADFVFYLYDSSNFKTQAELDNFTKWVYNQNVGASSSFFPGRLLSKDSPVKHVIPLDIEWMYDGTWDIIGNYIMSYLFALIFANINANGGINQFYTPNSFNNKLFFPYTVPALANVDNNNTKAQDIYKLAQAASASWVTMNPLKSVTVNPVPSASQPVTTAEVTADPAATPKAEPVQPAPKQDPANPDKSNNPEVKPKEKTQPSESTPPEKTTPSTAPSPEPQTPSNPSSNPSSTTEQEVNLQRVRPVISDLTSAQKAIYNRNNTTNQNFMTTKFNTTGQAIALGIAPDVISYNNKSATDAVPAKDLPLYLTGYTKAISAKYVEQLEQINLGVSNLVDSNNIYALADNRTTFGVSNANGSEMAPWPLPNTSSSSSSPSSESASSNNQSYHVQLQHEEVSTASALSGHVVPVYTERGDTVWTQWSNEKDGFNFILWDSKTNKTITYTDWLTQISK